MFDPIFFPVAAIETWWWLPPLLGFLVASLCSLAGLSGAFLLLPLQVSLLGFTGIGVSATNHLYNTIATTGGVYQLWRQGRMLWPLAVLLIIGTLPGVVLGVIARIYWMHDLASYKVFVGVVLGLIALNLVFDTIRKTMRRQNVNPVDATCSISGQKLGWRGLAFTFDNKTYHYNIWGFMCLALSVGMVGGIYGIGGGAIITPFLLVFYSIPVYAIAAASLLTTFATSVLGVVFFVLIGNMGGEALGPDWLLGILLGLGGFLGVSLGARLQRYVNEKWIRLILVLVLLYTAVNYLIQP